LCVWFSKLIIKFLVFFYFWSPPTQKTTNILNIKFHQCKKNVKEKYFHKREKLVCSRMMTMIWSEHGVGGVNLCVKRSQLNNVNEQWMSHKGIMSLIFDSPKICVVPKQLWHFHNIDWLRAGGRNEGNSNLNSNSFQLHSIIASAYIPQFPWIVHLFFCSSSNLIQSCCTKGRLTIKKFLKVHFYLSPSPL
jgi:hypothetical protein